MRVAEVVVGWVSRVWCPRGHVERARELQEAEARRLDAAIARLARTNPCAAAVMHIGQALRTGAADNPPAQPRPRPDDPQ